LIGYIRLVFQVVCAGVVVWTVSGCGNEVTPEDRLKSKGLISVAISAAQRGDLDSAATILTSALRFDSTNAEAYYRLGMLHEYLGDPESAVAQYGSALRHDSTHAAAALNLGQLHGRKGEYDEALARFAQALRHSRDDDLSALAHYCVGLTWGIRGDAVRAADAYEDATQADTTFARAFSSLGQELIRQDKPADALPALMRAIYLDSTLPEPYANLAAVYRTLGRFDEAVVAEQDAARARERRSERIGQMQRQRLEGNTE
jgi:tetratricopeptide (TPR) repeat protein